MNWIAGKNCLRIGCALVAGMLSASVARADSVTALSQVDRVRIAEAFRVADAVGDRVWPEWSKVPFVVLLVTPEREFLLRHPKPSGDFTRAGKDDLLECDVWYRPRQYPTNLLATFPAVNGISTVVIGQAENTDAKTSTRWVLTLLHEHFHQLQNSQPGYYSGVDTLGLARGDTTGMWMLNYPFPYATPEVKDQFAATSRALAQAIKARQEPAFGDLFVAYVQARESFRSLLSADDYKYFAFQVWQEGVARYTEYRVAELAAEEYRPSKAFRELKDYQPFAEAAKDVMQRIEQDLETVQLDVAQRTAVYSFGAGEGLALDHARPGWRKLYFERRFTLDDQFRTEQ